MRSFFCGKCNLEFDLDEEFDDQDNTVFCPRCRVSLARILPETPERMIARERRLREARAQEKKKLFLLWAGTVAAAVLVTVTIPSAANSYWWMLILGAVAGIPAGFWTRCLTPDRSFRAGLLASVLVLLVLAADVALLWWSGSLVLTPPLRNLAGGIISAWIIAVFERPA